MPLNCAAVLVIITFILAAINLSTGWISKPDMARLMTGTLFVLALISLITALRSGFFARPFTLSDKISPRDKHPYHFWLTVALITGQVVLMGALTFSPHLFDF